MNSSGPVLRSALLGAAHGAVECAALFAFSDRYTLSKDWFLAVMIVFANATGLAVAGRYGVSLLGVALAGLAGMMVGGWLGVRLIGSYEYTVPTPPEDRELRIITRDGVRVVPVPGVPAETVKRVPVGGGIGVLLGWAAGAGVYVYVSRRREDESEADGDQAGDRPHVQRDPGE